MRESRTIIEQHIIYVEVDRNGAWYVEAQHVPSEYIGTATLEDREDAREAAREALQELLEEHWLPWDHEWA